MLEILNDLLAKKKKHYQEDYNEMLGDYKRELETIEGYNGRQLFELLQNCDDEGAKKVLIHLDPESNTLSISNDGNSFSEKGYRSLFIANLSSKTSKRKYIGNKGLGFRSIINWSNQIEIISNGISLTYSHYNLRTVYESLFPEPLRLKISEEEGLKEGVVPMPMLSMPEITEKQITDGFSTTIIITYKDLESILPQLQFLTSDIFLFLKSIEVVDFVGVDDKENISCLREDVEIKCSSINKQQNLIFNDRHWTVYTFEDELPDHLTDDRKIEKDLYQISIAIAENMSHSSPFLYSFFPTNIRIDQPYVLHATFDLDATRNQINDSEKNRFILKRIVEFTIEVAKYLSKQEVSYVPLKLLFHNHEADTLMKFGYYELVKTAIHEQPLFPAVNDDYITLAEALFVSNEMATLIHEVGGQEILTCHLKSTSDQAILQHLDKCGIDRKFTCLENYNKIINDLAALLLTIKQRARLIKIIVENFKLSGNSQKRFNLLADDSGTIVEAETDVYTPPTNESKLVVPGYAKIRFIDIKLFEAILEQYPKDEYEKRGKSRFIYDVLKDHCSIHSFEPITLAEKIIRVTNDVLEAETLLERKLATVKEMNRCLYHNYRQLSEKSKLTIQNIPSITLGSTISRIDQLHLSDHYPTGKDVAIIFDGIYSEEDYIASPLELGFTAEDSDEEIEAYLEWLGVNAFFKFRKKEDRKYYGYGSSLLDHPFLYYTKMYKEDKDNYSGYLLQYIDIEDKERIFKLLDIHKVIVLACIDKTFKRQLHNLDKEDTIVLSYRNTDYYFKNTPSFIKFCLLKELKCEGYLLDEKYSWINDFEVNYDHDLFKKFELNRIRVNDVLLNLEGVENIVDLSIEQLTKAFDKLNNTYPDGYGSQQFYKKALAHNDIHKLPLTRNVRLFARVNNKLKLFSQHEVFFSDNNFLPPSLSTTYPIFNFPLRAGAKKALDFFGINDLSQLNVTVVKAEPYERVQDEFLTYFNELKPYLLAYRLEDVQKDDVKEDQVIRLNSLKFRFCLDVHCRIKEDEFALSTYHYVYDNNEKLYYIKVDPSDSLQTLIESPIFVDHFSEILLNAFATSSEKQHFESVLRDKRSVTDYNIRKLLGDGALDEANLLLGTINPKTVFWSNVFKLSNVFEPKSEDEQDVFIQKLLEELDIEIRYDDFSHPKNLPALEKLFQRLNISVTDYNSLSVSKISTFDYNVKKLNNYLSQIESGIKQLLWEYLSENKQDRKSLLKYFNTIDLIKNGYESERQILESSLQIDVSSIIKRLLEGSFAFLSFEQVPAVINYKQVYRNNKQHFNQEQIISIENTPEIHSLLFFDELEAVLEFLNRDVQSVLPEGQEEPVHLNDDPEVRVVTKFKTRAKVVDVHKSSIYNPSGNSSSHAKVIGNRVEDKAFSKLERMYGEGFVIHKSKETEWEHYDIKYSKDKGITWIYVEVKSAESNKFTLTVWEKDFGEHHADAYEIWVYKNGEFLVLADFFGNYPVLNPTEYEVIFED